MKYFEINFKIFGIVISSGLYFPPTLKVSEQNYCKYNLLHPPHSTMYKPYTMHPKFKLQTTT